MSPTFEIVLEQVKTLSESEQAELARIISRPTTVRNGTFEERRAKIKAFQERFRGMLPGGSEQFLADKREEVELEERKWRS